MHILMSGLLNFNRPSIFLQGITSYYMPNMAIIWVTRLMHLLTKIVYNIKLLSLPHMGILLSICPDKK